MRASNGCVRGCFCLLEWGLKPGVDRMTEMRRRNIFGSQVVFGSSLLVAFARKEEGLIEVELEKEQAGE